MAEFNLVDEPWIPCIAFGGGGMEQSIRDTLLNAHRVREICDDSPLVTVSIHRLLLAILYRAYNGPRDFAAWRSLVGGGCFDSNKVSAYLDRWRQRFDLFGTSHPFFQTGGLETRKVASVNRLATEFASGNNTTLFDHSLDDDEVSWEPAVAARRLVACQSFALGFGKSATARIDGKDEQRPYSSDAIALRGMNVWLQGRSLFLTLMINLAPCVDASLPAWEFERSNKYRDESNGRRFSALGIVDRLTWQSRLIRLMGNGRKVSSMFFTQGRTADKSVGDPMKVYRLSKQGGISALPLSSGKAAWRDAHSILSLPAPSTNERRPECFNLVARARGVGLLGADEHFAAQVVGLASAQKKAGKFLLWRHDRMPVPGRLLVNDNLIERLGTLLQKAEQVAIALENRTRRIARLYLSPECESTNGRQPDEKEVKRLTITIDPTPSYWARLEGHFFELLERLPDDWDRASGDWKTDDNQMASRTWEKKTLAEASLAVKESIQSLGRTARAVRAVARVGTDFYDDALLGSGPNRRGARSGGK